MPQKVVFICGSLSGRLSIALLAALIRSRPLDEQETILLQLEEPIPPPVFLLSAPHGAPDDQEIVIASDGHKGHSLRAERHVHGQGKYLTSFLVRSRRAQSMTRRCRHRN